MDQQELLREEAEFLAQYDASIYPKPSVTVDNVILVRGEQDKLLLIQRKNHPFKHRWALPGGFINMDEDLPAASARELREETGLDIEQLEQIGAYGQVDRDPRDRIITVAYLAILDKKAVICAGDDAKEAKWFQVSWSRCGEIGEIRLQHEEVVLYAKLKIGKPSIASGIARCSEILASDLASDHARIIADSFLLLESNKKGE